MLKELRIEKGYTQKELANLINVSRISISMYENDKRYPDFNTFEKLCDVLNLNRDERVMLISSFAETKNKQKTAQQSG